MRDTIEKSSLAIRGTRVESTVKRDEGTVVDEGIDEISRLRASCPSAKDPRRAYLKAIVDS